MPFASYCWRSAWHYRRQILKMTERDSSTWFVAAATATAIGVPALAMGQACFSLLRYRWYYAQAPHPIIPSRGCCCNNDENDDIPPLRLLVVGDSLAMGIGMKESATPKLPETMARCLSQQYGRSVEWTCYGKPGLTADKLVEETKSFLTQHEQEEKGISDEWQEWKRRNQQNTDIKTNGYDIIVGIVGIADLKAKFLPSFIANTPATSQGFGSDLNRFKNLFPANSIVVLPALPIRPVPIFQYPPLSWFVHPLLSMLEQEKQSLAVHNSRASSNRVLFVAEPTDKTIQDFEQGRGPLVNMMLNGAAPCTVIHDAPLETRSSMDEKMRNFSKGRRSPSSSVSIGASLVALDQIHPNDQCYDFWGRHIASKLIDSGYIVQKR